jgi:hypothetical protein
MISQSNGVLCIACRETRSLPTCRVPGVSFIRVHAPLLLAELNEADLPLQKACLLLVAYTLGSTNGTSRG